MNIKPFKAIFPNLEMLSSIEGFFDTVKYEFPDYMKNGFFFKRPKKAIYVYQILSEHYSYHGLILGIDINDFVEGKVKKHEKTLAHKEQKLSHILLRNRAMVKPVLLGYPKVESIDTLIRDIIIESESSFRVRFEEQGETHSFWEVSALRDIRSIKALIKNELPVLYIADGHHRIRSMVTTYLNDQIATRKSEQAIFGAIFSFDQLVINDFNRVIEMKSDFDLVKFVVRISKFCKIKLLKKFTKPSKKHHFNMYINGFWYRLSWKSKVIKAQDSTKIIFDIDLFNTYILNKILKVQDVRTDRRIQYVEGTLGQEVISEKADELAQGLGFTFYPIASQDIISTADAGEVLPPKSTFFLPRIKNGLIVKEL